MKQLLDFYRYLRAFLIISVHGGFPERFLNLCNKNNIHLWDIVYNDGCVTAKIYCKDFFKLKKIRPKAGVKIEIKDKCGLFFVLRENKKRSVLITGMAAALVFMLIINQFVWIIDVEGNVNISKTEILNTVNTLGLKKGTFVPLFDKSKAGRDIVNLSDGSILWASINVKGSLACVEIREYTDIKPEENLSSSPCNIVADFDGVILSNDTYSGICCTSRGSAVKTGDILISGISENADGSVNFLKAEGKLTAFHKTSLSRSFNRKSDIQKLDTKQSFYVLDIFSLHIPLSVKAFSSDGEKYEYGKYLCLDNTVLPFGITEKSYITMTGKITGERKLIDIADEFTGLEYDEFKNSMITATDYCISAKNDTVSITATYDCIDFIGKKIDILKEN